MSLFSFDQNSQTAERLESLKAGTVGKLIAATAFVPIAFLNHYLQSENANWRETLLHKEALISFAIAIFSGFLFGVTYRYVVRQDNNPQLQSGAVGAFGLVRGFAQIEASLDKKMPLWTGGIWVAESLLLFGAVALSLNWILDRGWIQRMK
ncbi:hypothetical protein NDI45_16420 [Leptolyngbya sp. GB1-A1]|uniref:hypothetical protein n=1 Tax=Leptolyngbya sp. GB1-A1 TaxID=2933908 RepID=UPI003299A6CA